MPCLCGRSELVSPNGLRAAFNADRGLKAGDMEAVLDVVSSIFNGLRDEQQVRKQIKWDGYTIGLGPGARVVNAQISTRMLF